MENHYFSNEYRTNEWTIAVYIDNDPEAFFLYNYKTFTTQDSADKVVAKMNASKSDINGKYWDFGL